MRLPGRRPRPRRHGSYRAGFAATLALDIPARVLGAATLFVLVRALPVGAFAQYALLLALAGLASSAAGGGVRMRYIRLTAECDSRGVPDTAHPAFSGALATTVALMAALSAVGLLAGRLASAVGAGGSLVRPSLFIAAGGYAAGSAATELAIAHHQALRRFALAGAIGVVRAAVVLGIAVVVVATPLASSADAMLATFAGAMLVLGGALCLPMLRSDIVARRFTVRRLWLAHEERRLTLYYLAAAGFAYVDLLVAGALLDEHEIATLGASLRYLSLVLGAMPALGAILRVRTSQVDVLESPARQRELLAGWLRRGWRPCLAIFAAGLALAPLVIPVIDGGRYPQSPLVTQVLLATAVAAYLTAPAVSMLIARERSAWLARAYTLALVLNLLGDVAVARPFGALGIAAVSSTVYVLLDGATTAAALRGGRTTPRAGREASLRVPEGRVT
jgi:O-antigen/teichoic acid export membrane protein